MTEPVISVAVLLGLLLAGTAYVLYWVLTYDTVIAIEPTPEATPEPLPVTEWWWPSPEAFDDLTVTETETGWQLSAPDETELAEWLGYWNQSEKHHTLFQTVFVKALTDHANFVLENLEKNGKAEIQSYEQGGDRGETKVHGSGSLPEHELGSDSESTQA